MAAAQFTIQCEEQSTASGNYYRTKQNRVLQENTHTHTHTHTHTPTGICYKRKAVTFKVETFSFQSEYLT